jgi:hypothetical protein
VPVTSSAEDAAGWVRAAARNNAELCDVVCRSHGVVGAFAPDGWTCSRRTPPLYPDAVTLDPGADVVDVLERIDASAGASVKDSFAVMDLTPASFRVLFSAEWIVREPDGPSGADPSSLVWSRVEDASGLRAWESAWSASDAGTFTPSVLDELVVLRGELDGAIVAGADREQQRVGRRRVEPLRRARSIRWWCGPGWSPKSPRAFPVSRSSGTSPGRRSPSRRRAGFRSIGPLRVWINE